ncbi:MAG: PKD domain-containing protein, partial [Actinomycetota bacterium]|nr:PKD domain-containing protein [Actinomycetota bacterium]
DGSASTDPDGNIGTYEWYFGDGIYASVATTSHTYAAAGSYSVRLTVWDNEAASDDNTVTVVVTAPANQSPVANAGVDQSVTDLDGNGAEPVTLDGTNSHDPDGTIVSYIWREGVPQTQIATGASPSVSFAVGSHTVTLEVTDNEGASATDTVTVVVSPPANIPPTASFTYSCNGLECNFDGSASTDPDGNIGTYEWYFGDGIYASVATTSHTYAAAGSYSVTLEVTDDDDATDSTSLEVSPTEPSSEPHLWTTRIQASTDQWQEVTVGNGYDYGDKMVVVCTPNYSISGLGPTLARVRNATGTSFEVGLARPWFGAQPGEHWSAALHCMVVKAGVYTEAEHGVKMEAVRLENVTSTDNYSSWVGEPQTYANTYASPVVLGQVIGGSAAIPGQIGDWSVFWSRGIRRNYPPSSTSFYVGRHTGEDPNARPPATIGYVVIEAGTGTIEGV